MSSGYISLWREGEPNGLALTSMDLIRLCDLATLFGWDDSAAAYQLAAPGDGVEDDMGLLTEPMAQALAATLERALNDIPNHDARLHKLRPCGWAGPHAAEQGWLEEDPSQPLSPLEYCSGEDKEFVRQAVAFCRRGGFWVKREYF